MFRVLHPNRWFIWTLFFLLAAALLLMFFIESYILEVGSNTDLSAYELATWKTYRSKNLGIQIRYPASWQIEIDPQEIHQVTVQNPADYNENVTVFVTSIEYEKDIRASLKIASEKKISVDGVSGSWIVGADKNDFATSNVVLLSRAGTLYYIAGNARVFGKIVKSIKFLPPLSPPYPGGD